ncbi:MAG TPA: Eco57I restriction-modification methylase domain-containing protein [Candidatus Paceibacterota bacterium]|nr:Eco57I restriction-modification methylase domain-containing protein [Candidatus Pacearchaeota archaeon]HRZ50765.1 Eco57I restriction-modification methylase domain-containing protein [Candidatus Paceibacterota bacterium]HSA36338.1 Eco57I restriction-modification methylase domain-containing protein [Candidatus Paceibacterota bacterium]
MENKKQLGQFFTTNSDQILVGLNKYVRGKKVADPFAGNSDLLKWAKKEGAKSVEGFDIDKKFVNNKDVFFNDSLLFPKKYEFVLTNPPYLNINKADKTTKEKYFANGFEDLYQLALISIMDSDEGIVIVPINFLSAENSKKTRNAFFSKFEIVEMNYYKNQVFSDTTYNVIVFYYKKKKDAFDCCFNIKAHLYPDKKNINIKLEKKYGWMIGGSFINCIKNQKNELKIYRLQEKDLIKGNQEIKMAYNHIKEQKIYSVTDKNMELVRANIILLKAIDSGSEKGKIALEDIRDYKLDGLVSKPTSRHMVQLIFEKQITINEQREIIKVFNDELENLRKKYNSLFLTNYRDNDRKRISFNFTYKLINYLYVNKLHNISQETQDEKLLA